MTRLFLTGIILLVKRWCDSFKFSAECGFVNRFKHITIDSAVDTYRVGIYSDIGAPHKSPASEFHAELYHCDAMAMIELYAWLPSQEKTDKAGMIFDTYGEQMSDRSEQRGADVPDCMDIEETHANQTKDSSKITLFVERHLVRPKEHTTLLRSSA